MIQKVLLPKLGQTVERAVIETWRKAEGDAVAKGDILCEITTDKATLEVESYVKGTLLRIIGQAGQELPVNAVIAVVGDPGDEIPDEVLQEAAAPAAGGADPSAPSGPAPQAAPAAAGRQQTGQAVADAPAAEPQAELPPTHPSGRLFASPRARRLAATEHVPLVVLAGSGPEGRIVEADVRAYLDELDALKVTPLARKLACERGVDVVALAADGGKVTKENVLAAPPVRRAAGRGLRQERIGLSPMRRIIADRMGRSKREIPCYYLHMDVDFTDLMASRQRLNARVGKKISINDYIILTCGRALAEFPDCNSSWDGGGIIRRGEVNVSLAIALDEGLIVPVVRNVDRKGLLQVAADTRDLIDRARSKRLLPDEYEGGCMTVTNLGMFGIKHFIPIVNPGESCILGLGIIEERPVVRQGGIHIRQMMTMTLACDHRLIDGAVGARFLERIRDVLEHPAQLEA